MDMQKMLGRRLFGKILFAGFVMANAMRETGCSMADVIAELKQWVPLGISAVTSLLNLLGTFGIIPLGAGTIAAGLISNITTIFNDVLADIATWTATPSDSLLTKISNELQAISGQLSTFIGTLTIGNTKWASLVESLLSLFLSTIAGYVAGIAQKMGASAATANAQARRKVMMATRPALVVEPVRRKAADFRKEFNKQVEAAGYPQYDLQ